MDTNTTTMSPDALRAAMVQRIRKAGHTRRREIEQALLDTPRHEFVPDADLTVAPTTRGRRSSSRASAPWLVAAMLDQLDVHPSNRILESSLTSRT